MEKIILKFSGDAKIGIYRRSSNLIELDPRSGIAVLIDRKILPSLEKDRVYSVENPKFRIFEKCVILGGRFFLITEGEEFRSYQESIYFTYPVRVVEVRHKVVLTDSVKISPLGQVEEVLTRDGQWGSIIVKEETQYEESYLPKELEWAHKKIKEKKTLLNYYGSSIYLSKDKDDVTILDVKIIKADYNGSMISYSLKSNEPVYLVSFREYEEEWKGEKLFHLNVPKGTLQTIFNPDENGIVKINLGFIPEWSGKLKIEDSILTDRVEYIDDGEFMIGGLYRGYHSSGRSSSIKKEGPKNINRSGNVAIVEFWGHKYALAFERSCGSQEVSWDHMVTDDSEEINKMIREREQRIEIETLELEREKAIFCVKANSNLSGYYPFKDYSEMYNSQKSFEVGNIPIYFPNKWDGEKTNLYKQLEELRVQIVEVLKNASSLEDLEKFKKEFLKGKIKIEGIYLKGKEMISQFSNFFSEILKDTLVSLVSEEINEFYKEIHLLENIVCNGDLKKLDQTIEELKQRTEKLPNISSSKKGTRDQKEVENKKNLLSEAGRLGIPEYILNAFSGNIQNAVEFMSNVSKIETWRLDPQEISCGADPNDVKYYVVSECNFGENANVHQEEKGSYNNNLSTSNDVMAEALRKAGLI